MAQLILATAGRYIGQSFGGQFGGSVGWIAGTVLGGLLFPDNRNELVEGPRVDDLKVQTATFGRFRPIVFGSYRLAGNIIWATDIVERSVDETESVGGKGGGGPTVTTRTFSYYGNFAVAFCRGPIAAFRRVWADGKLIVDFRGTNVAGDTLKYGEGTVRFYLGTTTQMPDGMIESRMGAGNVPGYRGTAYIVFDNLPLADFGNRIPNITAEVATDISYEHPKIDFSDDWDAAGADTHVGQTAFTGTLPYAVTHSSNKLTVWNRYTGAVLAVHADAHENTELVEAWIAVRGGGNGPDAVVGTPWLDPVTYDVYVGMGEHGFGAIGGVVIFDIDLNFKGLFLPLSTYEIGAIVAPMLGRTFYIGQTRYMIVCSGAASGAGGTEIVGIFRNSGGLDDWDAIDSLYNSDPHTAVMAVDPSGPRAWINTHDLFGDEGRIFTITPTSVTEIDYDDIGLGLTDRAPGLVYDIATDSLILAFETKFARLDPDDLSVLEEVEHAGVVRWDTGLTGFWDNQSTVNGHFYAFDRSSSQGLLYKIDTGTLTVVEEYDLSVTHGISFSVEGGYWDEVTQSYWHVSDGGGDRPIQCFFNRINTTDIFLSSTVAAICAECDLTADERDVTDLTDVYPGYAITRHMTGRAAIEALTRAFFFDAAEIDFKETFVKRNNTATITIEEDDLAVAEGAFKTPEQIRETRQQELELPRRVVAVHIDQANDYQSGLESYQRIQTVVGSVAELPLELPIVLTRDQAKEAATRTLMMAWVERESLEFPLSVEHIRLVPTDVVNVQKSSGDVTATFETRLTEAATQPNLIRRFRGPVQAPGAFDLNVEGSDYDGAPADSIAFRVPTRLMLLNTPVLSYPFDDDGGFWWAAAPLWGGDNAAWQGAVLFKATDEDSGYSPWSATLNAATIVRAQSVLPAATRPTVWDDANTLTVRVENGTLSSKTDSEVYNGANVLILGDEVIQFATATLIADGIYELSHLMRGRYGTEGETDGHAIGEIGVMFDRTKLVRLSGEDIDALRYYKAVTLGADVTELSAQSFTNTGLALEPWAPAHVKGTRNGTTNDWRFEWVRRTRYNGHLRDGVTVMPLNEEAESYDVVVYASAAAVSGLRSISTAVASAAYTSAMQVTDFGSVQTTLTIGVFQKSATVGRGRERKVTV